MVSIFISQLSKDTLNTSIATPGEGQLCSRACCTGITLHRFSTYIEKQSQMYMSKAPCTLAFLAPSYCQEPETSALSHCVRDSELVVIEGELASQLRSLPQGSTCCRGRSVISFSRIDARAVYERPHPIYEITVRPLTRRFLRLVESHDNAASRGLHGHESHRRLVPFPRTGFPQALTVDF